MFIILVFSTILFQFIIYYYIQKETKEKIEYIDKYYFVLKYVLRNLSDEEYDKLRFEIKKEFGE